MDTRRGEILHGPLLLCLIVCVSTQDNGKAVCVCVLWLCRREGQNNLNKCSSKQTACMRVCEKKRRIQQQERKHVCDLAPFRQHQNIGHKRATECTMTQCDTAVPLPRMTSCTRRVWTSSPSPCGSFLFSVPVVTTGQPDRKRHNNQRGNKDVLIVWHTWGFKVSYYY